MGDGSLGDADDPLLAWAFATFNTTAFVTLPLVVLHAVGALGDLLGGLTTEVGLGLYLVLWGLTVATNRRWLAESDLSKAGQTVRAGAKWGAVTGFGFLVVLAVVVAVETNGLFAALVLVVGAVASLPVGAAVGAAFAGIDLAFVRLSAAVAPSTEASRRL